MKIQIRDATQGDIETILGLFETYYTLFLKSTKDENADFSSFKKTLKEKIDLHLSDVERHRIFITEDMLKHKPIGFAGGSIINPLFYYCEKIERIGFIEDFYVDAEYRHQGIGTLQYLQLLKWFEQNGVWRVELGADSQNSLALEFWKSHGFLEFKKRLKLESKKFS